MQLNSTTQTYQPDGQRLALLCAALILGTLVLYLPVANHEFVGFDDYNYVVSNEHVTVGLTWEGIKWAFSSSHFHMWHPLTSISHMVDCELFGVNARAHHLVNVVIHALNAALLLLALRGLTGSLWRAAAIAAVFAWHPLRVESVAWVAERKDVLNGFFCLLTLFAYARYAAQPSRTRYTLTLVAFACALMSKPMSITLPFVLLLLDFWPLRRWNAGESNRDALLRLAREKIPFFALMATVGVITLLSQAGGNVVVSTADHPIPERIGNAFVSYFRYLAKFMWPDNLAVLYPHEKWTWWQVGGSFAVVAMLTGLVLRYCRQRPWLFTGWFWFLGMLVPVIGLVQVGPQAMADRYTYLPMIGVTLLVIWEIAEWSRARNVPRQIQVSAATVALVILLLLTHWQIPVWQNTLTLFAHAANVTRNNAMAHLNVGQQLDKIGRREEADAQYQKALEIFPAFEEAHYNLGLSYLQKGELNRAAEHLTKAIQSYPLRADTYVQLAAVRLNQGRFPEAATNLLRAIELNPRHLEALHNLGVTYSQAGRNQEALRYFSLALEINPQSSASHLGKALALARTRQLPQAEAEFREVLRLRPDDAEAAKGLARTLLVQNKMEEAQALFQRLLQRSPNDATMRHELSTIYLRKGRVTEGLQQLRLAVQLRPDLVPALDSLAWLLATHPNQQYRNGAEAVPLAERAVQLTRGQNHNTLDTQAAAYAEVGRFADAVTSAEAALKLAQPSGNPQIVDPISLRLQLYRLGQAYREPPQ